MEIEIKYFYHFMESAAYFACRRFGISDRHSTREVSSVQ